MIFQGKVSCFHLLLSPHDRMWQCQPTSQWYHDWLKGGWAGESIRLPCIWTCLTPPMVVPILKLCRIQGKIYPNRKDLLWCLLLWYVPSYWWHIVTFLRNIYEAWWMHRSMDFRSSQTENISLQAQSPPPSPSAVCLSPCPLCGQRDAESRWFLRLWPHGWVRGARFMALCFVNFRYFCYSAEYGVAHAGLSEISFLWMIPGKSWPWASPHEEHYMKRSASDAYFQHNIEIFTQPNN